MQQEVEALWRSAQDRIVQARDASRRASSPPDQPCSAEVARSDSETGEQLPTLLTAPPDGHGAVDCYGTAFDEMDATSTAALREDTGQSQQSREERGSSSEGHIQGSATCQDGQHEPREPLVHSHRGTSRRFTAFTASPVPVRGLQRRSLAGRGSPRTVLDDTRRLTASECAQDTGGARQRSAVPLFNSHHEQAAALARGTAAGLDTDGADDAQPRLVYRGPCRKRFSLCRTQPAAPPQTQNILVLANQSSGDTDNLAALSDTIPSAGSGGLSGQSGDICATESPGTACSSTACSRGLASDHSTAEPPDRGHDSTHALPKPVRLTDSALRQKRAVLFGRCLLQELEDVARAVDGAITSVTRLRAWCMHGGARPRDLERLLCALRQGAVPAGWTAGDGVREGVRVCGIGQGPWLRARTVAAWLEGLKQRILGLHGYVERDWSTATWVTEYHDLAWPDAMLAAAERVFAAGNQYVLGQVETRVCVGPCEEPMPQDEVHFLLPPPGTRSASLEWLSSYVCGTISGIVLGQVRAPARCAWGDVCRSRQIVQDAAFLGLMRG